MAVKGFAVAVTRTFAGDNQFQYLSTWIFGFTVVICAMTQMNYFNKALDLFSTNRVTPSTSIDHQSVSTANMTLFYSLLCLFYFSDNYCLCYS